MATAARKPRKSPRKPVKAVEQYNRPIGPKNDILTQTQAFVENYVAFENPHHSRIVALWVIHTHAFDAALTTPYVYVTSAEKRSGKTTLIETCKVLANNPVMTGGVTASSIFRLVEAQRPALFVDEADTIFAGKANEELRGILNTGYKHNGQTMKVLPGGGKADDEMGGVRFYSTFAPKMMAGIDNGRMPETIADRCIKIVLKRKREGVNTERFHEIKVERKASKLRNAIHEWGVKHLETLMEMEVSPIDEIDDRAFDVSEPLLAIARLLGVEQETREDLIALLVKDDEPLTPGASVLLAARTLFEELGEGHDRILSAALTEAAGHNSPQRVSNILKPYGIKPTTIRLGKGESQVVAKGYYRADFEDAWSRYL